MARGPFATGDDGSASSGGGEAGRWLPMRRLSPRGRRPFVLVFHDVPDAAWFARFLDGMVGHARFLDVDTFMDRWARGALQGDELLLTFDDGFRTVYDVVEPACAARGVPYVTFVLSEVLEGGPAPWTARLVALLRSHDPTLIAGAMRVPAGSAAQVLAHAKELSLQDAVAGVERAEAALGVDNRDLRQRYLTPEMVRVIHRGAGTVGLHTHRHATLSRCPVEVQREEIGRNIEVLEGLLGQRPRWFAYPNGTVLDFDARTVRLLADLGVSGAFTTVAGPADASADRWRMRRIGVNPGDSALRFVLRTALPWVSVGMYREARWRAQARRRAS